MTVYCWTDSRNNRWTIALERGEARILCARDASQVAYKRGGLEHEDPVVQFVVSAEDLREALKLAHMTGQTACVGNVSVVGMVSVRGSDGSTSTRERWSIRAVGDGGRLHRIDLGEDRFVTPQQMHNVLFVDEPDTTSV
jgi:hypothetical protein